MSTINGRGVKVEVALTFGTPLSPTAVSKAFPGVATLTAHGLANGAVGYWTVSAGMVELDLQAILVNNQAANTWEMPGLDTTNYSTYTAGTFTPAATWGTITEAAGYSVGGGAPDQLEDTRLHENKHRNVAGLLASQDVTIDVRNAEISGAAMAKVEQAAQNGTSQLYRITKGSQVLRVFYGTPSLPGESVQSGQLASGQFAVIVPAWCLKPNV